MVSEDEVRLGFHTRHMASGAGASGRGELVPCLGVDLATGAVVIREVPPKRSMWIVAGQAAYPALAPAETRTGGQQRRLMTRVPRVAQVHRHSRRRRHTVALP